MQKTGERYAAARLALLQKQGPVPAPKGAPTLEGYTALSGVHPDTALLASALMHSGAIDPATGKPFTETKLFGLSGGIGFMYFLFEYAGHPPMLTFNCRTWTTPWPVIGKALDHAGITYELHETGGAAGAAKRLEETLAAGRVAQVTADYASLPWSGMAKEWRGQMGRQMNVVGRTEEGWVVDTGTLHVLDDKTMREVRGAVKKEKNRLLTFAPGTAKTESTQAVHVALKHTAHTFRNAPYKNFASNFGLAGLAKAEELIGGTKGAKTWSKVFDSGPFAFRALQRVFECAMLELTPPAGGRPLYAEFLDEVGGHEKAARHVRKSGEGFEALADTAIEAGGALMTEALQLTERIDELRRNGVGDQTPELLAQREALCERCDLDAEARADVFGKLAALFGEIRTHETAFVETLEG